MFSNFFRSLSTRSSNEDLTVDETPGTGPTGNSSGYPAKSGDVVAAPAHGGAAADGPHESAKKGIEGVPDIEYPSQNFSVKNTFIDTGKSPVPESLLGFYEPRGLQSEPPAVTGAQLGSTQSVAEDDEDFLPAAVPSAGGRNVTKLLGSTVSIAEEDEEDDDDFVPKFVPTAGATIREEEFTPASDRTCAGTSPTSSQDPQDDRTPGLKLQGLPRPKVENFDYPALPAYTVKNGFIDTGTNPLFSMVEPLDDR